MKKLGIVAAALLVLAGLAAPAFAEGQFDHIISAADVSKVTGIAGVKQVSRVKLDKFRNGDLNFMTKDDKPLLMIQFRPIFLFDQMKADPGYFKAAVPGVGQAAFSSPSFAPQFSVNFIKGGRFGIVTTHVDPKDKTKTVLSMDQVTAIAKLVASKM